MKLDHASQFASVLVACQFIINYGAIGRCNKEIFLIRTTDFSRDRADGTVAAGDIKNSSALRQLRKLLLPKLEHNPVIVVGFAGAESCYESLLPETRPLLNVVVLSSDDAPACR